MTNTYELIDGKHSITIISNSNGRMRGTNHLVIKYLFIELSGSELRYWTGRFIKDSMFTVKLETGRPYEHLFQGIKIFSRDQKVFNIEM
ncbi:MAG: hypothetical protein V1866_02445 [archaeon]